VSPIKLSHDEFRWIDLSRSVALRRLAPRLYGLAWLANPSSTHSTSHWLSRGRDEHNKAILLKGLRQGSFFFTDLPRQQPLHFLLSLDLDLLAYPSSLNELDFFWPWLEKSNWTFHLPSYGPKPEEWLPFWLRWCRDLWEPSGQRKLILSGLFSQPPYGLIHDKAKTPSSFKEGMALFAPSSGSLNDQGLYRQRLHDILLAIKEIQRHCCLQNTSLLLDEPNDLLSYKGLNKNSFHSYFTKALLHHGIKGELTFFFADEYALNRNRLLADWLKKRGHKIYPLNAL
jgi:hypothetical protein